MSFGASPIGFPRKRTWAFSGKEMTCSAKRNWTSLEAQAVIRRAERTTPKRTARLTFSELYGRGTNPIALRTDRRDDACALESPVRRDHDNQPDRLVVMGGEQVSWEKQRRLLNDLGRGALARLRNGSREHGHSRRHTRRNGTSGWNALP